MYCTIADYETISVKFLPKAHRWPRYQMA